VAGTGVASALPEPRGARRDCLGRSMAASASAVADVVVVECWWQRRSSPPSAWIGMASPRQWGLFPAAVAWIRADPARWWLDPAPLCSGGPVRLSLPPSFDTSGTGADVAPSGADSVLLHRRELDIYDNGAPPPLRLWRARGRGWLVVRSSPAAVAGWDRAYGW
jgi:hypothetical protein